MAAVVLPLFSRVRALRRAAIRCCCRSPLALVPFLHRFRAGAPLPFHSVSRDPCVPSQPLAGYRHPDQRQVGRRGLQFLRMPAPHTDGTRRAMRVASAIMTDPSTRQAYWERGTGEPAPPKPPGCAIAASRLSAGDGGGRRWRIARRGRSPRYSSASAPSRLMRRRR